MSELQKPNVLPIRECTDALNELDAGTIDSDLNESVIKVGYAQDRKLKLIWRRIIAIGLFHLGAVYGAYLLITSAQIYTGIYGFIVVQVSGLGITAGAHRLWSHRTYKATLPLRVLLMTLNSMAFQFTIIFWVRDHRVHHKYSDTDADPHNPTRGFFYAHVGWVLCRKHPDVKAKGKTIDVSDLKNDPVLQFQNKHYIILVTIFCFILPTLIPVLLWSESITNAWYIAVMLRWTVTTNITWSVNSFAHLYGNRPYDRFMKPTDNKLVAVLALGEGWHNYHHTFPWDYKTGELSSYRTDLTTLFIECMAKIGWAYDLKTSGTAEVMKRRIQRTGDGTHQIWGKKDEDENKASF